MQGFWYRSNGNLSACPHIQVILAAMHAKNTSPLHKMAAICLSDGKNRKNVVVKTNVISYNTNSISFLEG